MYDRESAFQCFNVICVLTKYLLYWVLGRDNKFYYFAVSYSPSFSFKHTGIPVWPYLELLCKHLMFNANVIHDDKWLVLVTVPPLVAQFWIVIRVINSSLSRFANPRGSPDPDAPEVVSIFKDHVILGYLLQSRVMLHIYRSRNLIKSPFLCLFLNIVPVFLSVPADRANAELVRAIDPCIFFHAVVWCLVLSAKHFLMMDPFIKLFEYGRSDSEGKVHEELDMRSLLFLPLFKLTYCVDCFKSCMDFLQIFLCCHIFWVVESQQPSPRCH